MVKKELLVKSLKHYCDTIWEYEYSSDSIYVHYDRMTNAFEGKSVLVGDLITAYRSIYGFETGENAWEQYLNEDYLRMFFEDGKEKDEFRLRFYINGEELKYYYIRIEKMDENNLMITGKDMFDEINERSLHKSLRKSFESILNIDVDTGTYFISYSVDSEDSANENFDYEARMIKFVEEHALEAEKEALREKLSLENIKNMLEIQEDYSIFVTIYDKKEGFAYKRIMYSYFDTKKKLITVSRIDLSNVVKKYEEQISRIKKENYKDALTGAYNRNFYEANIKDTKLHAGIAVIDIDDFKISNDVYGHIAGDKVLETVAKIIRELATEAVTVIRYGGDEFVLIMPEATEEAFSDLLREIQQRVWQEKLDGYEKMNLSISVGGVISKDETVEDAVHRADKLMYKAKEHKNSVATESSDVQGGDGKSDSYDEQKKKQQILVVDDSEINRLILNYILQDDYKILNARNGQEALELIEQYGTGISLVLLDIIMPVKGGFEVLNYMNMTRLIEEIPVIMISGDGTDANIKRAYSMGISDFISKPFDSQIIYRRVSNTIMLYAKQRKLISIIRQQHWTREKKKNEA